MPADEAFRRRFRQVPNLSKKECDRAPDMDLSEGATVSPVVRSEVLAVNQALQWLSSCGRSKKYGRMAFLWRPNWEGPSLPHLQVIARDANTLLGSWQLRHTVTKNILLGRNRGTAFAQSQAAFIATRSS